MLRTSSAHKQGQESACKLHVTDCGDEPGIDRRLGLQRRDPYHQGANRRTFAGALRARMQAHGWQAAQPSHLFSPGLVSWNQSTKGRAAQPEATMWVPGFGFLRCTPRVRGLQAQRQLEAPTGQALAQRTRRRHAAGGGTSPVHCGACMGRRSLCTPLQMLHICASSRQLSHEPRVKAAGLHGTRTRVKPHGTLTR